MRVALLPSEADRTVLARLAPGAEVVGLEQRPDTVVILGSQPVAHGTAEIVRDLVSAGATAVVVGAPDGVTLQEIAGTLPSEAVGSTEVFATKAAPSVLTVRAADEFAVQGSFRWLVLTDEVTTILTSSIRFVHRPALVERQLGAGRIITSGFGVDALDTEELARILRNAVATGVRRGRVAAAPAGSGDNGAAGLSAERELGLAVVGYGPYGGMGFLHGAAAEETDGLAFVAAMDTDAGRRKAAESQFPGVAAYPTLDDLLGDDGVDVVVVATPPSSHADITRVCLQAGKHVAVEKPLCITTAEADELLDLADEHDVMLTVHQNRRWDPDFRALRRLVDTGQLGELFNVETFVGGFEHPCRAWHSEESISGGAIYDWGSHHLDWILLLMGDDPITVTTTRHKRVWHDISNDDQVRVRLAWADGREAEFLQSDIAGIRRPKFYVQGTEGTVAAHYKPFVFESVEPGVGYQRWESHHAEAPVPLTLARHEPGWGLTETVLPPLPAGPWPFHRNVADHLLLGEPLDVDPVDIRAVIGVLEAAQRSGVEGGTTCALDLRR